MGLIGKEKPGLGFMSSMFGKGFSSLGRGLKSGTLSSTSLKNPSVLKGIGLISLGMLGTTQMLKMAGRQRDKLKQRGSRHNNRQLGLM